MLHNISELVENKNIDGLVTVLEFKEHRNILSRFLE